MLECFEAWKLTFFQNIRCYHNLINRIGILREKNKLKKKTKPQTHDILKLKELAVLDFASHL